MGIIEMLESEKTQRELAKADSTAKKEKEMITDKHCDEEENLRLKKVYINSFIAENCIKYLKECGKNVNINKKDNDEFYHININMNNQDDINSVNFILRNNNTMTNYKEMFYYLNKELQIRIINELSISNFQFSRISTELLPCNNTILSNGIVVHLTVMDK